MDDLDLCGGQSILTRQDNGDVTDSERWRLPYVDEMVQIVIKFNERLIDLPTFLLPEKMLLLLLVVVLQLQLLVLWVCLMQEYFLGKLRNIYIRYGFYQMF